MPGRWLCRDCDAAWPADPGGNCPCGGGHRTLYQWMGAAQTEEEARVTAFEYYFAHWDDRRLRAEREVMERLELENAPTQVESD